MDSSPHSMFPSYASFGEGRHSGLVPLHGCDNNFLTVVGLYSGYCSTIEHDPGDSFAHSHGGMARKLFGSGGFSNAIQISDKGVAKIPRVFPGSEEFDEERFYRDVITELRICLWKPIREHPNIINLEDVKWFPGPHPSIPKNWNCMWPSPEFETADGTLTALLRARPGIEFLDKVGILFDIAKALDCLHQNNVVHSDVKPDNIFIFPGSPRRYTAKLADFGCSKILQQEETHGYLLGGTRVWSAPEADERLSREELRKTDLYSFGLVVWQVITDGYGPFGWLESWFDTTSLSQEVFSELKQDDFLLSLSQESLSELPLSELEMSFSIEVLSATLCPVETRAVSLTPVFEKYIYLLGVEGDQHGQHASPEPADAMEMEWVSPLFYGDLIDWKSQLSHLHAVTPSTNFVGPVPLIDIRDIIHKATIDDRLRVQIFNTIRDIASPGHNTVDEFILGSVSWQLFLCYHHGFGTARDIKAAISALTQACELGHGRARSLVAQFHQAHGIEHPPGLPIVNWLEECVRQGYDEALKPLRLVDLEAYKQIAARIKNPIMIFYSGIYLGGDQDVCDQLQFAEQLEVIKILFDNYNPESEALIRAIEQDLGSLTGSRIIHFAAAAGMEPVVRGLLDNNICKQQVKTQTGFTALWLAFRGGYRDTALLLLSRMPPCPKERPDIGSVSIFEAFCLHHLSEFDPKDILEVATQAVQKIYGAATNSIPLRNGKTCDPIMRAIMDNSLESVKVLLELGGRRAVENILTAAELLSGDILELLMWDFADKERKLSTEELQAIYYTIATESDPLGIISRHGFEHSYAIIRTYETLDYFTRLWHLDSYSMIQKFGFTALYIWRRHDIIQLVIDPFFKDAIFLTSDSEYPPLWWSMRLGDMENFSLLLDYGAATCDDVAVVFSKSAKVSNSFFVAELIRHGCLLDDHSFAQFSDAGIGKHVPRNMCFLTPFETAITFDCFDTAVQLYRDTGRHVGHSGFSKLDFLLYFCEKEKIWVLPPFQGGTALHHIQGFWCVEPEERRAEIRSYMIKVVKRLPHMVNTQSCLGRTPIFGASLHHNILLVEALIESGANLDIKDNEGYTVLDIIMLHRLWEVLRVNPNGPELPPRDMYNKLDGWLASNEFWDIMKKGTGMRCGPKNILQPVYRGDSYDKRLDEIYSMIKAAGGSSTINGTYSRVETLEQWTEFWERRNRERITGERCTDEEELELMVRFVRARGLRWYFEYDDGSLGQFVVDSFYYDRLGEEALDKTVSLSIDSEEYSEPKSNEEGLDEEPLDSGISDT